MWHKLKSSGNCKKHIRSLSGEHIRKAHKKPEEHSQTWVFLGLPSKSYLPFFSLYQRGTSIHLYFLILIDNFQYDIVAINLNIVLAFYQASLKWKKKKPLIQEWFLQDKMLLSVDVYLYLVDRVLLKKSPKRNTSKPYLTTFFLSYMKTFSFNISVF